ncbi:MAG: hypothetical protein ACOYBE_13160 [Blautia sp.]
MLVRLVLGDARHDGQPRFALLIQGVDIVALEEDSHFGEEQAAGVTDGVRGVLGKTGDLFDDDKAKAPGFIITAF